MFDALEEKKFNGSLGEKRRCLRDCSDVSLDELTVLCQGSSNVDYSAGTTRRGLIPATSQDAA